MTLLGSSLPLHGSRRLALARRENLAASMLPYKRHIDPSTLATRDGALIQCLRLQGLPADVADADELNYRKRLRDAMWRGLASSRTAIYHHIVRTPAPPEPPGSFTSAFAREVDDCRRAALNARRLFTNDLFLTLVRRTPLTGNWLDRLFGRGVQPDTAVLKRELQELYAAREVLLAALDPYGPSVLSAYDTPNGPCSEPLELMGCLFNGDALPILSGSDNASAQLPRRRVSFGFDTIELAQSGARAREFAAMISLKEYPPHTAPGLLDALLAIPRELIVTESFSYVDRQAVIDRMNLSLRRMRAADDEAISQRRDLAQAKDAAASGEAAFGEHHLSVMVRAGSVAELDAAVGEVQAACSDIGAVAVREDVALEPAFWAQFPGNAAFTPRKAMISSANFASLASFHNQASGQALGNHWGECVTTLETASATPYHFNFHRGDLGNFIVIGPSGSGKTVLLNFLLAQADKFNPRIAYFDKDRGAELFLRAMGGRYDRLRQGVRSGLNPLQLPPTPANRRFLQAWLGTLLTAHGESLSSDDNEVIADAIAANFELPPEHRRLRYLREMLEGVRRPKTGDLAARLAPWVGEGDRSWLFDNERDEIDLSIRIVGFDMTQLLDDPAARTPAMMYLFHRVEERLDDRPSIIVVDEGWKALDDDIFVSRIRDWEKTIRKRNGVLGFVTQSAGDALSSRIASAIIEQSPTQIFMSNPKAQRAEMCQGFGLTPQEFEIVRSLPDTSHCFLIRHGPESVVARLDLSGAPQILPILAADSQSLRRAAAFEFEDASASYLGRAAE